MRFMTTEECRMMTEPYVFHNWAETIECEAEQLFTPATIEEVVEIVRKADAAGKVIRVFGAAHSWSGLDLTNGILINLDRMKALTAVDLPNRRVTVQAGARIKDLVNVLYHIGLGMANV